MSNIDGVGTALGDRIPIRIFKHDPNYVLTFGQISNNIGCIVIPLPKTVLLI